MKFSVGYQIFDDGEFIERIIKYKNDISEVYFSFGDFPNGRNNQLLRADMTSEEAEEKQLCDLARLTEEKIPLNILFNATCYGKDSQSRAFFQKIGDSVDFVLTNFSLSSVTTTSPLIAKFIKSNFERLDVRASVNMAIGTTLGMEYIKDTFDSFYMKRELNRDFRAARELKSWCDANGKTLYALANSGCLNSCSLHTFHDNLVSHESEISAVDNAFEFSGACRAFLSKPENLPRVFECTNFIRPEDVHLYEGLFPAMKLATRVNSNPMRVLDAYIGRGRHVGSVFDLCEPNHTSAIYPKIIENSRIESKIINDTLIYTNIEGATFDVNE